jgi:hypothetical protein
MIKEKQATEIRKQGEMQNSELDLSYQSYIQSTVG